MSDVTRYRAAKAELVAALTTPAITIGGVPVVVKQRGVRALMGIDGIRKPVVGVTHAGMKRNEPYSLGSREFWATTFWDIGVVAESLRDTAEAEEFVDQVLETLHDRIEHLDSAVGSGVYTAEEETYVDAENPAQVAAVARFSLEMILGK